MGTAAEDLRAKYKGADMQSQKDYIKDTTKDARVDGSGRPGYHEIKAGKNVFRLAPPHDPKDPAIRIKCLSFLPTKKKDSDELTVKSWFNARIHGGLKYDLVEEYIKAVERIIGSAYADTKEGREKKKIGLKAVYGYRDKATGWHSGIKPQISYVAYAWKGDKFGRLELKKTVIDRMEELSISEEADQTIQIDPFTDPEKGVSLIIEYNKELEMQKKYKVNKGNPKALTDEQLLEFDAAESLKDMLTDKYSIKTFNSVLEGLLLFDEINKFNIFDHEDFVSFVETIKQEVPADSDADGSDDSPDSETAPPPVSAPKEAAKKTVANDIQAGSTKTDPEVIAFVEQVIEGMTDISGLEVFVDKFYIDYIVDKKKSINRTKLEILAAVEDANITFEDIDNGGREKPVKEEKRDVRSAKQKAEDKQKFLDDLHKDAKQQQDETVDNTVADRFKKMQDRLANAKGK